MRRDKKEVVNLLSFFIAPLHMVHTGALLVKSRRERKRESQALLPQRRYGDFQKALLHTCRVVFAGPGWELTGRENFTTTRLAGTSGAHSAQRGKSYDGSPTAHVSSAFMERFDAAVSEAAVADRNIAW
jgi:hypothetical protein